MNFWPYFWILFHVAPTKRRSSFMNGANDIKAVWNIGEGCSRIKGESNDRETVDRVKSTDRCRSGNLLLRTFVESVLDLPHR